MYVRNLNTYSIFKTDCCNARSFTSSKEIVAICHRRYACHVNSQAENEWSKFTILSIWSIFK